MVSKDLFEVFEVGFAASHDGSRLIPLAIGARVEEGRTDSFVRELTELSLEDV